MNHSLSALMTKLKWQQNDLIAQINILEKQAQIVRQQIQEVEEQIDKASINPLIVLPEFEINRLNFITQQQDKKEGLLATLRNHNALQSTLNAKLHRIKTEINMLEKYLQREDLTHKEQQRKAQDNALDEWIIQKKEAV